MRLSHALCTLALASLAACGGGGGGAGGGGNGSGLLKGNVVAVNGSSSTVVGVTVKSLSTGATTTTNTAGGFTLPGLPPGLQPVTFKTSSGSEQEIEVEIEDGGEVRVSLSLNDDGIEDFDEDHCASEGGRTEARASLVALSGGLKGYVRVRRDADGDQGFDVEVEYLTPGQVVAVVVISTTGEQVIGTATASGLEGEAEVELRTSDGDSLPFGVGSVAALEGYGVEVRNGSSGGAVLMEGLVPAIGALPDCTGSDDSDGNGVDDDGSESEGSSLLTGVNGALGRGKAEIESEGAGSSWKLEVEVEDVALVTFPLSVYVNLGSGFVLFGTMLPGDEAGEYEYELEDEDSLPSGLTGVSQLWQQPVEVRDNNGVAVFIGNLPTERTTW